MTPRGRNQKRGGVHICRLLDIAVLRSALRICEESHGCLHLAKTELLVEALFANGRVEQDTWRGRPDFVDQKLHDRLADALALKLRQHDDIKDHRIVDPIADSPPSPDKLAACVRKTSVLAISEGDLQLLRVAPAQRGELE